MQGLILRTARFITYQYYKFDYDGGIHGYFNNTLQFYDYVHNECIDCSYLIKKEYINSMKRILIDVALQSKLFKIKSGVKTKENAYFRFLQGEYSSISIKSMTLPCLGLYKERLVFSCASYDIDCFASGCYHVAIPYKKYGLI